MTTSRRSRRALVAAAALAGLTLAGCDDDTDTAPEAANEDAGAATTVPPIPTVPDDVVITAGPTFATVPDTGVPGLESADAFCAAWSRFGGSWQLMIVQSAFTGDSAAVSRLEVVASPLVTESYGALFDAWPVTLESERDVVADAYFGAFQRRSEAALEALIDAGAADADLEALAARWQEALAGYDPVNVELDVALDPDLADLVDTAAATFAAARPPIADDPSMVITAETPATDSFLATACPDQGWISGADVVGDG